MTIDTLSTSTMDGVDVNLPRRHPPLPPFVAANGIAHVASAAE